MRRSNLRAFSRGLMQSASYRPEDVGAPALKFSLGYAIAQQQARKQQAIADALGRGVAAVESGEESPDASPRL